MTAGLRLEDFGWHTIRNLNQSWIPGQCIGLSGPSGSGKTLFLRALADLDPHFGRAWLDGRACDQLPAHLWRRQVGLLPAESAWWHDTVGPHLEGVDTSWLLDLGFDPQVLHWRVDRLSSGERQRLALLRLLLNQPRVLLLDEPTANLDRRNRERTEAFLADYQRSSEPVILWVSHDSDQLQRWCDPVYVVGQAPFSSNEAAQMDQR